MESKCSQKVMESRVKELWEPGVSGINSSGVRSYGVKMESKSQRVKAESKSQRVIESRVTGVMGDGGAVGVAVASSQHSEQN